MQQNVINYIPQTYRYRRPIWQLALFLALFFVASVGILFGIFGLLAALLPLLSSGRCWLMPFGFFTRAVGNVVSKGTYSPFTARATPVR